MSDSLLAGGQGSQARAAGRTDLLQALHRHPEVPDLRAAEAEGHISRGCLSFSVLHVQHVL